MDSFNLTDYLFVSLSRSLTAALSSPPFSRFPSSSHILIPPNPCQHALQVYFIAFRRLEKNSVSHSHTHNPIHLNDRSLYIIFYMPRSIEPVLQPSFPSPAFSLRCLESNHLPANLCACISPGSKRQTPRKERLSPDLD